MTGRITFIICIILAAFFAAGCVDVSPKLVGSVTPPPPPSSDGPVFTAPPTSAPVVTDEPTVQPSEKPDEDKDAFGNIIYGSDHFERYISFKNILVYEENGGTFVDLTAENVYPQLLLCAVNITFYNNDGGIIASSSLQMPDGSYLLALNSGSTSLYARVLTDTLLTDKDFVLTFDPQTGVKPQ